MRKSVFYGTWYLHFSSYSNKIKAGKFQRAFESSPYNQLIGELLSKPLNFMIFWQEFNCSLKFINLYYYTADSIPQKVRVKVKKLEIHDEKISKKVLLQPIYDYIQLNTLTSNNPLNVS